MFHSEINHLQAEAHHRPHHHHHHHHEHPAAQPHQQPAPAPVAAGLGQAHQEVEHQPAAPGRFGGWASPGGNAVASMIQHMNREQAAQMRDALARTDRRGRTDSEGWVIVHLPDYAGSIAAEDFDRLIASAQAIAAGIRPYLLHSAAPNAAYEPVE